MLPIGAENDLSEYNQLANTGPDFGKMVLAECYPSIPGILWRAVVAPLRYIFSEDCPLYYWGTLIAVYPGKENFCPKGQVVQFASGDKIDVISCKCKPSLNICEIVKSKDNSLIEILILIIFVIINFQHPLMLKSLLIRRYIPITSPFLIACQVCSLTS